VEEQLRDLDAELHSTQRDLKSIVGGDLQLGAALSEIEVLRKQVAHAQQDREHIVAQVLPSIL
jgi:hypothetical protein